MPACHEEDGKHAFSLPDRPHGVGVAHPLLDWPVCDHPHFLAPWFWEVSPRLRIESAHREFAHEFGLRINFAHGRFAHD